MPTFLANRKMHPALRARIARSVAGQTTISHEERPTMRALLRGIVIGLSLLLAGFLGFSYRAEKQALEGARATVLGDFQKLQRGLSAADLSLEKRVGSALGRESGSYLGDLGTITSNDWVNGRSSDAGIYVRLATSDARDPTTTAEKSLESNKDALLDCFLNPPEHRDEKSLFGRVRKLYSGSNPEPVTVYPASSVFLSLVFLSASFESQIRTASSKRILDKLSMSLSEARLPRLIPALKARYLIAALDEPKMLGVRSELDGAARHFIRLVVVDLRSDTTLFRTRKEVDPGWISEGTRFRYALGLDSCRFGRDARLGDAASLEPPK